MATPLHLPFRRKDSDDKSDAANAHLQSADLPADIRRIIGMLERLPAAERVRIEQVVAMSSNERQEALLRLESSTDSLRKNILGEAPAAEPVAQKLTVETVGWNKIAKTDIDVASIKKFVVAAVEDESVGDTLDTMHVARRLSVTAVRDAVRVLYQDVDTGQVVRTEYQLPFNDSIDGSNRIRGVGFSFVGPERTVYRVVVNLIFQPGESGRARLAAHVVRSVEAIR